MDLGFVPPPRRPIVRHAFSGLNVEPSAIPEDPELFRLTAHPQTDLWRKPPSRDTSTAPVLFTSLRFPFVSAEVTVSADWKLEWDQAGLVIFASPPAGGVVAPTPRTDDEALPPSYTQSLLPTKWVKIGLELIGNTPHLSSTHATESSADWSLMALPTYHAQRDDLRVQMQRLGHALWLYYEDQIGGWKKVREINGFFWGTEDKSVRVGVYASRPASWAGNPRPIGGVRAEDLDVDLVVDFEDLMIF